MVQLVAKRIKTIKQNVDGSYSLIKSNDFNRKHITKPFMFHLEMMSFIKSIYH